MVAAQTCTRKGPGVSTKNRSLGVRPMYALGYSRARRPTLVLVRCYPNSGQRRVRLDCPLCAAFHRSFDHLSGSVASYHTRCGLLAVNHARLLRRRGGRFLAINHKFRLFYLG
jgi:hypothetical protein